MSHKTDSREEGMALLLSMIFLIAMAIALAGFVSRVQNQVNQVEAYVDFEDCLQGVEAAVAAARAEITAGEDYGDGEADGLIGVSTSIDYSAPAPFFGDSLVTPVSLPSNPSVEFFAITYNWANDGNDNNGDGTIDDSSETDYATILAFARTPTATRRVEVVLSGGNVNVWQNAIFAGTGQSGNLINGNVAIHGSVHLLGDSLAPGDISIAALDLSGTSLIHNNYVGLDGALAARIPPLPTTEFGGEIVGTLEAKLRVKNGLVGMSGNSEVGEPNQTGNSIKETMDGIYVTDGWTGNGLDANGDPINAYSDNGVHEEYDLSGAVPFPTYDDDGGRDHLNYYLETGPIGQGLQHVYNGDMTIQANRNFYWNATNDTEASNVALGNGDMPSFADLQTKINSNEFFVWFDAGNNRLVTNGRIPIDGDLTFARGSGNDKSINYSGKGTFLTYDSSGGANHGDVSIEVDLRTVNMDGTTAGSFPHANLLGVMAERNMTVGSNSQLEIMGGFYAQDTVTVNKQTVIVGTIVGNNFDMGTNVPEIYQVPELPDAWDLEDRMIGAEPVIFWAPLSWREIGVT